MQHGKRTKEAKPLVICVFPLYTAMNPQRSRNYISYFSKYPEKDIDSTLVNHKLITTGYLFHIYMIIVLYDLFIFASNFHIHRIITNI